MLLQPGDVRVPYPLDFQDPVTCGYCSAERAIPRGSLGKGPGLLPPVAGRAPSRLAGRWLSDQLTMRSTDSQIGRARGERANGTAIHTTGAHPPPPPETPRAAVK